MESKELRLNNYVFGIYIEETENADIEEKCICSVDVIDGVGCTEYNIWASSIEDKGKLIEEWERFEPIPITEKWLLDFGFKTMMVNLYKLSIENWEELYVSLNSDGNVHFYISNGFNEIVIRRGKLCIHHLQNVFHDFTGEELTINTPTRE